MPIHVWSIALFEFVLLIILSLIVQSIPVGDATYIAVGATRACLIAGAFIILKYLVSIAFPSIYSNSNTEEPIEDQEMDED